MTSPVESKDEVVSNGGLQHKDSEVSLSTMDDSKTASSLGVLVEESPSVSAVTAADHAQTSVQATHVYVRDEEKGWVPGLLISRTGDKAVVARYAMGAALNSSTADGDSGDSGEEENPLLQVEGKRREKDLITVSLSDYPSKTLPLQEVDTDGRMLTHADMINMPYLHEAAILYNLKERYEGKSNDSETEESPIPGIDAILKSDTTPYTRSGDIVVAINPYRWITGLYAERTRHVYAEQYVWKVNPLARKQLPPHIYEASSSAFRGLIIDGCNQSILVSGESGAGKTVSVKILMSHLATFHETKTNVYRVMQEREANLRRKRLGNKDEDKSDSFHPFCSFMTWFTHTLLEFFFLLQYFQRRGISDSYTDIESPAPPGPEVEDEEPEELNQTNLIVQRVLDSNPVLEAFGNAKTALNDNSSRFSKYVKLQFDVDFSGRAFPSCNIAGSLSETYLLEKSRVVAHDANMQERTFHIFYQLMAAPQAYRNKIWSDGLGPEKDVTSFKYVGYTATNLIEGQTDEQRWRRTVSAMSGVGLEGEKLTTLLRALCVVMQLGNLVFDQDPSNEEGSTITSDHELDLLSGILCVPSDEIRKALTYRTVTAVDETLTIPLTSVQAKDTCDAFAKEIYSRLFDSVVETVNEATRADKNYEKAHEVSSFGEIGLLDIFGFESFETNRFEQLCINHANERLQNKFTEDVFRSVQAEYKLEGVSLSDVSYEDNNNIISLLEGRMGLLDILNEECVRPKGSDTGFVNKVYANNTATDAPLIRSRKYLRHQFGIRHYAGPVTYDATNFVAKNQDTLPGDVVDCAIKSTNELIRTALVNRRRSDAAPSNGNRQRKGALINDTVWTKFKSQLTNLMTDIGKTKTWYVRCINPNRNKAPGALDLKYTAAQLKYAGLVSAVTMSRAAFPNRLNFSAVLDRYRFLATKEYLKSRNIRSHQDTTRERRDVDYLLDHLLKSKEEGAGANRVKAYVCGKTRVYFRFGALEYLESLRHLAYERCATIIQSVVRRKKAIETKESMRIMQGVPARNVQPRSLPSDNSGMMSWLTPVFDVTGVSYMASFFGSSGNSTPEPTHLD